MNLSINYEETKQLGNQIISKAQMFDSLVRNVNELNAQVSQVWTGVDANKYLATVNEQNAYMRELAQTIELIGNYLVKVGNAYEQAASDNSSAIR